MMDIKKKLRYTRKNLKRLGYELKKLSYTLRGKQIIHFLHIGKTGGTAIKHVLKQSSVTNDYAIFIHNHETKFMDIQAGEKIIFFLRDPISRFVSAFYSRKRQGQPRIFNPWKAEEKIAFEYFETPNELAIALSSHDLEVKSRAEKAMRSIGHVKSSYWDWFQNEEYIKKRISDIFFIGFQESLTKDFTVLKKKLGTPDHLQLPNDDIKAHRNPKGIDKSLEAVAVKNLKQWYIKEYQFIELCRNIIKSNLT